MVSFLFSQYLINLEKQLNDTNKLNKRNEGIIRDLKREMTFLKYSKKV
jgi:hypothetical protein